MFATIFVPPKSPWSSPTSKWLCFAHAALRVPSNGVQWRGVWHKAMVLVCLPLVAPVCLSPLLILTLYGSERVLVVSTEPLDDLSCLTTPRSAHGGGGGGLQPNRT